MLLPPALMKVRLFISASAALLCLWLGATYVRVVPMETYGESVAPESDRSLVEVTPSLPAQPGMVIASQ